MPPEDAMQVEFVTPKDIPRYPGAPSTLRTSGTEQTAQGQAANAKNPQPPTVPTPPQPQEEQHQAQHDPPPQSREPQAVPQVAPQVKAPPLPTADAGQIPVAQPAADPPASTAEETPDTSDAAAKTAYLALAGGKLGGGLGDPPIDSPLVGYDYTMAFRRLLSTCGALPSGVSATDKIRIVVRVFLNRDGTVAQAPQLLDSSPSSEQQTLMQNFAAGLQKCQPYTMLPPDLYSQWKTLDLVVHPHNYLAQ
jgi:hypothetical protein